MGWRVENGSVCLHRELILPAQNGAWVQRRRREINYKLSIERRCSIERSLTSLQPQLQSVSIQR